MTVARFFRDLRLSLHITPPQAAYTLRTSEATIAALESADVLQLPPWAETQRIISEYTALARIDSRAVIMVVADLTREALRAEHPSGSDPRPQQALPPPAARAVSSPVSSPAGSPAQRRRAAPLIRIATEKIATEARRLPQHAIRKFAKRPDRAFYAVSLPLALLFVVLNGSVQDTVAKPFKSAVNWVSGSMQQAFPRVRDGFTWIEVSDPRSRRADKLPPASR